MLISTGAARITVRADRAHNVRVDGRPFGRGAAGTESRPCPAPSLAVGEPGLEARRIVASAGVRPLDAIDCRDLGGITLPARRIGR
jgi:hypothetical protein